MLVAAHPPTTFFTYGAAAHIRRVGTRRRLGQGKGTEQFAAGCPWQPLMFLFLGAAQQDRVRGQKMRSHGRSGRGTGTRYCFHHAAHRQAANAQAAILLWQVDAHATQIAQRPDAGQAKSFGFIVVLGQRLNYLTRHLLGTFNYGQFFCAHFKVHAFSPALFKPNAALSAPNRGQW